MRSLVPRTDDRRTGLLRMLLGAATVAGLATGPSPAKADAIRSKATPLAVFTTGAPLRCPSAGEINGQRISALSAQAAKREDGVGALALVFSILLPTPALALCDPDLAGTAQTLGPFGGATHYPLTADVAVPGTRALGTQPEGFPDSELVPGDRIELPAAGPRSVLTLVVATRRGAQTVQLPPLGTPRATAVRIEGPIESPVVAVEWETGDPTRTPVDVPKAVATRVIPRLNGREVRFHGTAAPGAVITGGTDDDGDLAIASNAGRFKGLTVRVGPRRRTIEITIASLPRRQAFVVTCKVRWSAARKRADKITCAAVKAATAARAADALRAAAHAAHAVDAPAAAPAAPAPRATAARALPTVEASVTRLATFPLEERLTLAGDVNGDGRPEVVSNRSFDGPARPKLFVSRAAGLPAPVPVRVDQDSFSLDLDIDTVADLDGDGRDELASPSGMLVTDALSAAALPVRLDLRSVRPTSPRDIDLGLETRDSPFTSFLNAHEPQGSVADTTGDGRPELVLGNEGISAIYPSQAIVPGVRSRLPQVFPLAWLDDLSLSDLNLFGGDPRDMQAAGAVDSPGELTIGGRLVTLAAANPSVKPAAPRTFLLRQFGGAPTPLATTAFTATGIPLLLDYDQASGDYLVALFQKESCGNKSCLDRVLRINPAGVATSVVATRRAQYDLFAAFVADGPDADTLVDTAISLDAGLPDPPTSSGEGGTVAILASAQTGARKLATLPVLARGGEPIQALDDLTARVLPNGSRWLATQTAQRRRSDTGTYALLGQRP